MKGYMLAIAIAGLMSGVAQAQDYLGCINKAEANYKQRWRQECGRRPEVKSRDADNCPLPVLMKTALDNELKMHLDLCSQAKAAGALR